MSTYERIRYEDRDGKRHTVILRNPKPIEFLGRPSITGIEVDKEAEDYKLDRKLNAHVQRQHIIQAECILRRQPMRMNLKYGELELA